MEESWEKFRLYFAKVETMISAIYRQVAVDKRVQISQDEYMECNR
jgi:hypothetical protein